MSVTVVDHPLAQHLLLALRDTSTEPARFRAITKRLTVVLMLEAARDLPTHAGSVETPLGRAEGMLLDKPIVTVPILRAGLGMLDAVVDLFPAVRVGYLGLQRDEATFKPSEYYVNLPRMEDAYTFVLDPMLATGGSASAAVEQIKSAGAPWIRMVAVVAAPEGVAKLHSAHPDVAVYTAAIDHGLDVNAYIVPGLGDFGDRLFGTEP
ncbi:MAG: uracil phosphoribosyltransferase [Actinomycetota bacterium]|nr:uracil phosphoribosyltransferase [Actinomycetota bacterium]